MNYWVCWPFRGSGVGVGEGVVVGVGISVVVAVLVGGGVFEGCAVICGGTAHPTSRKNVVKIISRLIRIDFDLII
jgi:hypothetical protein